MDGFGYVVGLCRNEPRILVFQLLETERGKKKTHHRLEHLGNRNERERGGRGGGRESSVSVVPVSPESSLGSL